MAGDWIPMRVDLWDCPEVVRILSAICPQNVRNDADKCPQSVRTHSDRLRAKCEIIGALHRTWSLFDQHSDDGTLAGYDAEALNEAVGINGWAENLQHVGWLVIEAQALVMPKFTNHLGQSAKRRLQDSKRKRTSRSSSPESTSAICPQNVRNDADKMRTTEQNRTEQKIREEEQPSVVCPAPSATEPDCPPDEPTEFVFPVKGKTRSWTLTKPKLDEYVESFPGLDVHAELRKARQWTRDNPQRCKTARGMPAFLTRWLTHANDRPRAGPIGGNGNGKPRHSLDDLIGPRKPIASESVS